MKLSVLSSAVLLAALAATGAQAADTLAKVAEANKITLAYRESSVPFSYLEAPGKPIGFAVDIANAVVAAVKKQTGKPNLEVGWMAVTSQNRIPLLSNGTIDLECGSTTNNTTRGKEVDFAINHFYTGTRLLVKKSSGIKNWADLKGKKVAITTGTTNMLVVRKYNDEKKLDLEVIGTKDHADALLLVETDRASAFPMDDILLFGLKANAKDPAALDVVGDALQVEPYACMLRKDDPKFKALVDGVITGMMKSGEFEKLYNKWFMGPIPPKNQAIGLPMNQELKDNIQTPSDKPAV
ncbi:MAG: transporter substrate-binding domain-containing protein [Rhodocyclaceae bacterium]|nr:transporter substrate-binding domain-containing protein [Rhodocyclaceae bacterium]MDQ8001340.1 transporter substrate-binding domain-containing protein [Pseudomonadota bacterium]MDQ8019749.1 transporter substrate-binding domain-containing protein [Pseudomonadota bacterium]